MSGDLYAQLKDYEKRQSTKLPTSGTVAGIDGSFVDVSIGTTILRNVRCVGTPSAVGQLLVLTWENGTPTAHVTGGSASSQNIALVRGPQGETGPTGATGAAGATGPEGPPGSLSTTSPIELLKLGSTPSNPPSGSIRIYPKSDDKFYQLTSGGTEKVLRVGNLYYTTVIGTFLSGVTVPGPGTYHSCPFKIGADGTSNNFPWPEAGDMIGLSFRKGPTAQPVSGDLVITLYVNGSPTALTVTVPAGTSGSAATFTDNAHTVTIAAEDQLRWVFSNAASAASCQLTSISMRLKKLVSDT